jgi:hypothetical protein
VLVRKIRGRWTATLNRAIVPRVRLNQTYAALFQQHRSAKNTELAQHLQEARWTVKNVQQRFSTILMVAEAILKRQQHFLEFGPMAMKPLGLREIAEELGLHESTVSRVTNNKYMATPVGVFELKYFFSREMATASGGACSATGDPRRDQGMIEAESATAPLSDAQIARLLVRQGLRVARRTVTKYRQLLKLPSVERRRRVAAPDDAGLLSIARPPGHADCPTRVGGDLPPGRRSRRSGRNRETEPRDADRDRDADAPGRRRGGAGAELERVRPQATTGSARRGRPTPAGRSRAARRGWTRVVHPEDLERCLGIRATSFEARARSPSTCGCAATTASTAGSSTTARSCATRRPAAGLRRQRGRDPRAQDARGDPRRARPGLRLAERRQGQFLAMLSHEMRNPLARSPTRRASCAPSSTATRSWSACARSSSARSAGSAGWSRS